MFISMSAYHLDVALMLIAKFSVQPVDRGWAVRVGPDVLVRFSTKDEAISEAVLRMQAIRRAGGAALVIEEPEAATERDEAP